MRSRYLCMRASQFMVMALAFCSVCTARLAGAVPAAAAVEPVNSDRSPTVVITGPVDNAIVTSSEVSVRLRIRVPPGAPLLGIRALVDGRIAAQLRGGKIVEAPAPVGPDGAIEQILSVPVPPHDCTLTVVAETAMSRSVPVALKLRWRGTLARTPEQVAAMRPALYVLAVGVSNYSKPELRLRYAAKDAQDFAAVFKAQNKVLYQSVEMKILSEQQATRDNILDALEWLQRQTTSKDVAILFFAGHGITDPSTGMYYFLPYDADPERIKRTMLPETDVRTTLANIPGKVLLFLDTCHSGKVYADASRGLGDVSTLINELASAENGVVVFAASTGRQASQEAAEWNNGAFTRAVVEGLRGQADSQKTGRITLNMLDLYISERVKELTGGRQTPTTAKPSTVQDFPIAVVRGVVNDDVELVR